MSTSNQNDRLVRQLRQIYPTGAGSTTPSSAAIPAQLAAWHRDGIRGMVCVVSTQPPPERAADPAPSNKNGPRAKAYRSSDRHQETVVGKGGRLVPKKEGHRGNKKPIRL